MSAKPPEELHAGKILDKRALPAYIPRSMQIARDASPPNIEMEGDPVARITIVPTAASKLTQFAALLVVAALMVPLTWFVRHSFAQVAIDLVLLGAGGARLIYVVMLLSDIFCGLVWLLLVAAGVLGFWRRAVPTVVERANDELIVHSPNILSKVRRIPLRHVAAVEMQRIGPMTRLHIRRRFDGRVYLTTSFSRAETAYAQTALQEMLGARQPDGAASKV